MSEGANEKKDDRFLMLGGNTYFESVFRLALELQHFFFSVCAFNVESARALVSPSMSPSHLETLVLSSMSFNFKRFTGLKVKLVLFAT